MKRYRFSQAGVSKRFLTVEFRDGSTTAGRLAQVKVPLSTLANAEFMSALDNQVRRDLMEAWSGVPIEEPLFD